MSNHYWTVIPHRTTCAPHVRLCGIIYYILFIICTRYIIYYIVYIILWLKHDCRQWVDIDKLISDKNFWATTKVMLTVVKVLCFRYGIRGGNLGLMYHLLLQLDEFYSSRIDGLPEKVRTKVSPSLQDVLSDTWLCDLCPPSLHPSCAENAARWKWKIPLVSFIMNQ
jgi:hypothetical protein